MADDDFRAELEHLFAEYGDALGAMDAPATAALWAMPGLMVTDDVVGAVESRERLAEGLAGAYPQYREQGLAAARATILEHRVLSPRLVRALVHWDLLDASGERVDQADFEYLLRRDPDEDAWRIHVAALAVGELENPL
ncbi:hypothetical protein [Agrococcus terreus]|uniref:DUF4440 domain-containing protein n=1 Tax=Agrococcus terreus TaxID=574649 RepID=A0ABQ2KFF3_9MICO|nr:hypothetical protein [Agrococcus terreus]GGN81874.1 hypothetical protein GCM10010968_11080 [Agrococcus terreus]